MDWGMKIFAGIIGAVVGFIGTLVIYSLFDLGGNDPIMGGMLALVVFAPMGAFICGALAVSMVPPSDNPQAPVDDDKRGT
jgi:hypothetical protein